LQQGAADRIRRKYENIHWDIYCYQYAQTSI
jgi:hypothetical protein